MTDGLNQTRTGSFKAVVRAGTEETAYHRTGAGRPIVALSRRPLDDPGWNPLIETLATRYRVIVPMLDTARPDFAVWLRSFLDGIGLTAVVLLADEPLSAPAVGFAVLDTDRVEALVVLADVDGDSVTAVGETRVLTVRRQRPAADVVDLVERFFAGQPLNLE